MIRDISPAGIPLLETPMTRWRFLKIALLAASATAWVGVGVGRAQEFKAIALDELRPMLKIEWRLGPDYPMGIQDSAVGCVDGKIVSAGGFTRHPLDICKRFPDAFGGQPSGFTSLAFVFDPKSESAGWTRIADMPGPARQGAAVAVVDNMLYAAGGMSYTEPLSYCDTYRLKNENGKWVWEPLETCQLPWPAYGAAASTAVIGKKIYLCGLADFFLAPGGDGPDFHSEAGRDGTVVGRALLVLDTTDLKAGWKRLSDCPGVPKFDSAIAVAGGKIYQLGGVFGPLAKSVPPYSNAIDSWVYDPAKDHWTRLRDTPPGSNRRALVYADRYILLIGGYNCPKNRNLDQTETDVYNAEEKKRDWRDFFETTVFVYDTKTGTWGKADSLAEKTSLPSSTTSGDALYCLGGEGGPRLWHPATLQIGKIIGTVSK
jgi:N-acetylneuraminic acid mutarotase